MSKFERLIETKKLIKSNISKDMVKKEIESSIYDLEKAKNSFSGKDFKWTTVQSYYSIFHSMRALLFNNGFREKSHYALSIAIYELCVKNQILNKKYYDYFLEAMDLRESADYNMVFSEESSKEVLGMAEEVLFKIKEILSL